MADQTSTPLDRLCLEALKAIGKTLSQMNLYKIGHPAVAATIAESHRLLTDALAQTEKGDLAISIDHSNLVANGRIVGNVSQVPNSVASLFSRFKLNSLAFKTGVPTQDLSVLCELAAIRPDQAKDLDPAKFLRDKGVTGLALNEAIYAKVDKATETPPPVETAATPSRAADLAEKLERASVEESLSTLVKAATPDPKEQARLYELVMQRVRENLENRVREATSDLLKQKNLLENEHARTQAVLSNMAEGVVVVDDAGKVLMMNPAAEEIYGTKLVDVAGKPLAEAVKEEHLLTLANEIQAPADRAISKDVVVFGTDDSRRTLRASAAVVQNEQGKPVGMVSVLTDVTKQKELAKVEREFVAHVTHELRAPLSAIRAALEILQGEFHGTLEPDQDKMLTTALKNSDRLADLIRDILDFSKVESGQMTVHAQPVAADKMAREAVESLQPWAQKKGIHLTLDVAPAVQQLQVQADPGRTVQALVNLLSNAIKFTPKAGSIRVMVAESVDSRGRFVRYAVADTGPGIAKQDHEKVFEKFVQIAAGERHVGGTGLGLAIAKALIHLQRGQMGVDSELGKGATFHFTLPVYVPPVEEGPQKPPPKPVPWWKKLLGLK